VHRNIFAAVAAGVFLLLAGCATRPPAPKPLVWPAPPESARIKYVRSIYSEKDLEGETSAADKLLNFLGGAKAPPNSIVQPAGVAVSDDGNLIYVADFAQSSVFKFDLAKKTTVRIGDGGLGYPSGVALDATGNLYVVESGKKQVSVFDADGKPVRVITDPAIVRPTGIGIDRGRGRIYVADTGHSKSPDPKEMNVKIYDLAGKRIGTLGHGKGFDHGYFLFPTYVTVDRAGDVYVADTLNSRVQKFDPDGKFVKQFGQRGNGWGMFDKPKGIALDSFGNVYVVDSGWSNVQIFNQEGEILLFFGGRGRYPGLLSTPAGIAIDGNNRIYVSDYLNHRVEIYQLLNTTAADSVARPAAKPGEAKGSKLPASGPAATPQPTK